MTENEKFNDYIENVRLISIDEILSTSKFKSLAEFDVVRRAGEYNVFYVIIEPMNFDNMYKVRKVGTNDIYEINGSELILIDKDTVNRK